MRFVRRHPLVAFVVLAYGLSWSWWIPMAVRGDRVGPGHLPTQFPGLLGPLIAAFLVTAVVDGRAGIAALVRSMVRWRTGAFWFLVALVSPFLLFALTALARVLAGYPSPSLGDFGLFPGLPPLSPAVVFALVLLVNGFGEETGWRGFVLPHLSRDRTPLVASLWTAAIWAGWHAPLFFILEGYRGFGPVTLVGFFFGLACGSLVLTQIFNRTGGSVFAAAIWHTSYNMVSSTAAARGVYAASVTTGIIVWAVVLAAFAFAGPRGRVGSIFTFGRRKQPSPLVRDVSASIIKG